MKGNIGLAWLLAAASCLSACGGGSSSSTLTPVPTTETSPQFISYPDPNMFTQGIPITPLVPTITGGIPTNYLVQPDLPAGLNIDGQGVISGTPTVRAAPTTYLVTAGNSAGTTSFGVRITVAGRYTIGGAVFGLSGPGLVLSNNGGNTLSIDTAGTFTFAGTYPAGYGFFVDVVAQPAGQTCSVAGGSGQVANSDYGNVVVTCSANTPKMTRPARTLSDVVQALADQAGRTPYLACLDPESSDELVELLGDALAEFEFAPASPSLLACGSYSVTTHQDGLWVYVTDEVTHRVKVYSIPW